MEEAHKTALDRIRSKLKDIRAQHLAGASAEDHEKRAPAALEVTIEKHSLPAETSPEAAHEEPDADDGAAGPTDDESATDPVKKALSPAMQSVHENSLAILRALRPGIKKPAPKKE